ncbi:DNA translocase FtsK 4TM domain-containing protein, partial [Bartonella bacilliformis]
MRQDSSSHDLSANQYGQSSRLVKILLYQIGAFIGLGLFSLIIFCVVSLATWNVADPSLTRANMHKITNLMGWPGAVFSDLFMQFFGLASLCVLLPPFFWSLLLMVYKDIQNFMVRLCWWVVSIICLSAFFSLITPLSSWTHWPLPIGLGGIVGDKVIQIISSLFPVLPSFLQYVLWSCFFVFSGFLTAVLAGNVVWRNKNNKSKKTRGVKAVEPIFDMPEEVEHTANETRLSFFATIFGAILHLFYYLQACYSRLFLLSRKSDEKNKILNRVDPVFYDEEKEPDYKKVPVSAS